MDTPSAPSQITIRPQSTAYDPSDERWLAQVQTLLQELRREVGPVQQVVTPLPGKKGGAVDLILALGSAGAFTVALTAFKAWLKRD